jgi:transcriptional regulator with XRE-family HTH domain
MVKTRDEAIGPKVRALRQERRQTQVQLARLLGVTQGYLSKLERGRAAFTAQQLFVILRHFNVPLDRFSPPGEEVGGQIQNALAREGASHLLESDSLLPSDRLRGAAEAIREALVSAQSARQVAAIAPVLVEHAGSLNLSQLRTEFRVLGLENRYGWAIESVREALRLEGERDLPREWRLKYRRAEVALDAFFAPLFGRGAGLNAEKPVAPDILDPGIASAETLRAVSENLSPIAKRWRVITSIETQDFVRALRAARGGD